MAEIGIAPLAATGARSLSSQLQSSLATGSRMHGGRDDALRLALLAAEPPADADPALDAVPDAVPAADPYPFVFGATGTLQNVAVICSMQIVPVMGACDGACWPLGAPPRCGVFGAAIRSWMFAVGTCAETGDIAGTSAALSVTTNATRFMCPAPFASWTSLHRLYGDAGSPFSTQCPSSTPFFRRSLELWHLWNLAGAGTRCVGGNFSRRRRRGRRSARGCPGLPVFKSRARGLVPVVRLKGPYETARWMKYRARSRAQMAHFVG
jgi:hypothetical protein